MAIYSQSIPSNLNNRTPKSQSFLIEVHARTVYAVSDTRFVLGTVFENVTQMSITIAASNFSPSHPETKILYLLYVRTL